MTKDFIIGFLLGVIIVLLLTRYTPTDDGGNDDDSARQGTPRDKWSDLTDDERETLRKGA